MISNHSKVIIIGSGPAGLTAGIYSSRANLNPIIIEGRTPGGQLISTTYVENWPGIPSILGPQLMASMHDHAKQFGCTFVAEEVVSVDFTKRPFTLTTHRDSTFNADSVIIATGATPQKLGITGEQEYWGRGVTTCAVCDGAFYPDKHVIVVGGGDTAMEHAAFLTKFTDKITIVHILDKLTASYAMQQNIINNPKINIIYNSTLSAIHGSGSSITEAVITNQKTKKEHAIPASGIFIAIGLKPNSKPFQGALALTDYGFIKVTKQTHTSVEGVFAAGDVVDERYRQAITSAGTGCMAALDAEHYLSTL